MKRILLLYLILITCSCGQSSEPMEEATTETKDQEADTAATKTSVQDEKPEKRTVGLKSYTNRDLQLKISYPENWIVVESEPEKPFAIINIFPKGTGDSVDLPLQIHAPANISFVSIFPDGFGTEPPAGKSKNFADAPGKPDLKFPVNDSLSEVYYTQDGQAWAYSVYPENPPPSWDRHGFFFAQAATKNFEAKCYDEEGNEKSLRSCDPLAGDDFRRMGDVDRNALASIRKILESISFVDSSKLPRAIPELLKVEKPLPNAEVKSPLSIKGKARGTWYFEGSFSILLEDSKGNILDTAIAEAEGNWMTESFVPFSAEMIFDAPDDERGYLIFRKANPSGLEKNARAYNLPVLFPPRN